MRPSEARTARETEAPPPVVLDRYVLQRRLGSGAFGTVWLARDERLERDVAVKLLPRERVMGGRFEREARVAARLSHPGIVTLYEATMDDEGAYLVSELVRGATLDRLLDEGRLSDRAIVNIGIALCDALDHAHEQGVVHRDVKPSNVLIPGRASSPSQLAKLTDFGVARVVGGDALTRTGDIIGTLAYMAPEQAEGLEAGPSADLYSLALVLYEALTGINPIQGAGGSRRLGTYLPPLRRQRRDLPRVLGSAIDMALRPRARERGRLLDLRRALVSAHDLVGDEPGVVGDPWSAGEREEEWAETAATRRASNRVRDPDPEPDPRPRVDPNHVWINRGAAALCAAGTAAWLSAHALAPVLAPPALIALAAAALTLLFPRIGWLVLMIAIAIAAAVQGHPGLAVLLAPVACMAVLLVPWRATSWPLPAAAPALGLIGLAGAWPAVAGLAGSLWRRAVLGAAGWVWVLVAGSITGRALYLDWVPSGAAPRWDGSLSATLDQVIAPVIRSGVLAPAAVWAAAAVVLPWLVRGRNLALDVIFAVIWAATTVSGATATIAAIHGAAEAATADTAVIGAVLATVLALGRHWLALPAELFDRLAARPRLARPRLARSDRADSGVGGQFP
jgi:hypothetical protein